MDLPLLSRASISLRRITAGREPGRRTEGAPFYKQAAQREQVAEGGAHMTDAPPIIIDEDARSTARFSARMLAELAMRVPTGAAGFWSCAR
jgi:hypothetical protein